MNSPSSLSFALAIVAALQAAAWPVCGDSIRTGSTPYRASVTGAGNSHSPVFSADGRHIAFVSHANNLVTNDDLGPHLDLFVRDLVTSNTVLVSVSTNGFGGANDSIGLYTLSSNAHVIAFDTTANNLAPADTNQASDIYVRDLLAGTTRFVSMNAGGTGSANGPSSKPLLSEDGRYVIFESLASNLVTNDFNGTNDIFICDLTTGIIQLVSVNADGAASPDGPSHSPSISADGLTVAFVSHATNLVAGVTNNLGEVYARDVAMGSNLSAVASHLAATRLSTLPGGQPIGVPYIASEPVLNASGRYVVFKTLGQTVRFDLQRPTNIVVQLFPPSPAQGALSNYFRFDDNPRLAVSTSETPFWFSQDGRFAAYSTRTNVFPQPGVMLVDFESFGTNVIHISGEGTASNYWFTNQVVWAKMVLTNAGIAVPSIGKTWTQMPWLGASADASRVLVLADATNLVSAVTNRTFQIYAAGVSDGTVQLISTNLSGGPGLDLNGIVPASSPDGSLIAWDSPDDHIVADDLNRAWDVFVRNVDTGETQLMSARHPDLPAASGIALSRLDLNPGAISANGRHLAVLSLDNTLAANDTNNWRDLFLRDLITGTNIEIALPAFNRRQAAAGPNLSADGRFIAFAGEGFSPVLATNRTIYWRDLEAPTNRIIAAESEFNTAGTSLPVLSADGRFVAFHTTAPLDPIADGNGLFDIYIHVANFTPVDHVRRNPLVVSAPTISFSPTGNGPSINPVISPDSTWVIFQSQATDLTSDPDTTPGRYQLFARQFLTDQTNLAGGALRLISYTTIASTGSSGISTDLPLPGGGANPRVNADSRYVAFESSPNLIYRHDLLNDWVTNILAHPDPMFVDFTNRARFTNDLVCSNCFSPTLNSDGRYVAYETLPVSGSIRGITVKDLQTGQEELISVSVNGSNGNGSSSTPLISHDARFVVFASQASDLVPGDNNRATDIFVRDRLNGVTHCLSRDWAGTGTGNRVSSNPILSADGRTVAFHSFASDLVPGDYNDTRDVFVVTLGGQDTDGDHMDDDWEMAYFGTLTRDGAGDFDSDGASDLAEFRAGTNPSNDASILRVLTISPIHRSPSELIQATLIWSAIPGRTYRVQFKDTVAGAMWMDVPGDVVAATPSASKTHTPSYYTGYFTTHRFYRVLLVQ